MCEEVKGQKNKGVEGQKREGGNSVEVGVMMPRGSANGGSAKWPVERKGRRQAGREGGRVTHCCNHVSYGMTMYECIYVSMH